LRIKIHHSAPQGNQIEVDFLRLKGGAESWID